MINLFKYIDHALVATTAMMIMIKIIKATTMAMHMHFLEHS